VVLMMQQLDRDAHLDHDEIARRVFDLHRNWRFCYPTKEHNERDGEWRDVWRLRPEVLQAFLKRTGDTVKWGKDCRYWDRRKSPRREPPTVSRPAGRAHAH
jgi:hypothetical protein